MPASSLPEPLSDSPTPTATLAPTAPSHAKLYTRLLFSVFLWGATWVVARFLVTDFDETILAAAVRFLLAAFCLALLILWQHKRIPLPRTRQDCIYVIVLATSGIFLYSLCFYHSLRFITAGRGALVAAFTPAVVTFFAMLLKQERITVCKVLGLLLAWLGCLTVIGNGNPLSLWQDGVMGMGEWLLMGCVITWSLYTLVSRTAINHDFPAVVMIFYATLLGAVLLLLTALWLGEIHLSAWRWKDWAATIYLAVGGTALAFTWFLEAVFYLGSLRASIFLNLVPVFAVLLSALFLGEVLHSTLLLGGFMVVCGVLFTTLPSGKNPFAKHN